MEGGIERKDSAESWTRRTTHTGDDVGYYTTIAKPVSGLQTLEVQCVAVAAHWSSSVWVSSVWTSSVWSLSNCHTLELHCLGLQCQDLQCVAIK